MLDYFKNIFIKHNNDIIDLNKCDKSCSCNDGIRVLDVKDIKHHFDTVGTDSNIIGYKENTKLISEILSTVSPNKKNIFILDDVCEIVDIMKEELEQYLDKIGKRDKVNIITLCNDCVGYDMLNIIANHPEIEIFSIITDITFGGNQQINGKKSIIDGVDVVLIAKSVNENIKFIIFTGNTLNESNVNTYNFSKKFLRYTGESILKYTVIKDANITFSDSRYESIVEGL